MNTVIQKTNISLPLSYFTDRLPLDMLLLITEFSGASIVKLATTSRSMISSFDEMSSYYLEPRHSNLSPVDENGLTTTILLMLPCIFKQWGSFKSTREKESLLCEAARTGDISLMNHIISLGVDVDAKILCLHNVDDDIRGRPSFPVEEATSFKQSEALEILFKYGANVNPKCNISGGAFLDGPTDLISSNNFNEEIVRIIIDQHIKVGEFDIFINNDWRSDERLFPMFSQALSRIPKGTLSNYGANCDKCSDWCVKAAFANGRMLCQPCLNDHPTKKCEYILWIPIEEEDEGDEPYLSSDDLYSSDED
jgi:hypothetical protein